MSEAQQLIGIYEMKCHVCMYVRHRHLCYKIATSPLPHKTLLPTRSCYYEDMVTYVLLSVSFPIK
jgi:hypothetical protein